MKKSFIAKMSVLLASIMLVCVTLTGCFGSEGDKEYTVQYSDDAGTHTLTVTEGMPYSLESVPYKYGYEFLGLYDAQTGGTQYVGANGASLSPYKDQENKVLFPQFKPIDYTVILDYCDATITGERSLTVAYNSNLPELPKNLTLEHNEFTGWYTEAGGKGTQVADAYGNLPVVSVLNEENFKLNESKRVYLYAGFELEKFTVTFIFGEGIPSEEVKVPYNTPISQVVPTTRNHLNEVPLTWSKSQNGDVYYGNVTDDLVLYVKEWAPIIELNGNGVEVSPIVARAGSTISLPTPTKPLAKFLHWEDENGEEYIATKMPDKSITLNAIWQGKIEFDENGGAEVDDISTPAGESITLPIPIREGFIFAGWYTAKKEQYTQTEMPLEGIALKAGWYAVKKTTINILSQSNRVIYSQTFVLRDELTIDLDNILSEDFQGTVHLVVHCEYHDSNPNTNLSNPSEWKFYLYSRSIMSDAYLLQANDLQNEGAWRQYIFEGDFKLSGSKIYVAMMGADWGLSNTGEIRDYYVDVTYSDTTYLYL